MKKKAYAFKIEKYKCLKLCYEENFIFNGLTYFLHDVAEEHDIQDIWLFLIFTTDLARLFTMLSVDMPIHCRIFFSTIVTKFTNNASFCLLDTATSPIRSPKIQARTIRKKNLRVKGS